MKTYFTLAALLLAAASASAQTSFPRDITLSWTNPSEYVDGSIIEAGDLYYIRAACFRNAETSATFEMTVPATGEGALQTETFEAVIPSPGTYTCFAVAIVIDGTESDESNPTTRKYIGKPLPPQIVE
jgi:hypothetical protein